MPVGRHFGLVISRMPLLTYAATIGASEDCRFVCSTCYDDCWGLYRLHGETAWLCSLCADMKDNGMVPGPRPFNAQPPRQLRVGQQLRSPEGVWTVTGSKRVPTQENSARQHARMYLLTREGGQEEERRGRDMADFHLIPAEFEHITRARCNELGAALTAAGLSWGDNGRQGTPRSLTYTATGPRGPQWSIRPVAPIDFDPRQPSNLWHAVRASPPHQSPALSARDLADHIREIPA
ncbi:hypothetical protein ABZT06_38730 [Streptomyces sp. NPDC005483]|uniref:hypothetical protein n=1 Tax=Streptomyces sp. NPDC005483 TaxID=3154882 RepID=UPI00339F9BF5